MKQIVQQQKAFFNTHATKNIDFRIEQLNTLEAVLKNNETLLNDAIYADFKKSEFDTYVSELALLY